MNSETKWIIGCLLAIAMICGAISLAVHEHHVTAREAMKAGYVEAPDVIGGGYHWEKAKP